MGIFDFFKRLFQRNSGTAGDENQEENLRLAFKARCTHFKELLSSNKRALEVMASLEEAMRGERFFSMSFVRGSCTTIFTNVFNMVRHLNALTSDPSHAELFTRLKEIQQPIAEALAPKAFNKSGPYVLPIHETGFSVAHEVGAKMATLGDAAGKLGKKIPDGFVITASGYYHFLEYSDLQEEINRRIQITELFELDAVYALSNSLQEFICEAPMPPDLEANILEHYAALQQKYGPCKLAVRSSAIDEDAQGASFAGQYHTELNVTAEQLIQAYKKVVASKYCLTAMTYRFNHGIPDDEVPMCVGCLQMIDVVSSGVAYSADPSSPNGEVVINAVHGLPKAVVDGFCDMDIFTVSRTMPSTIIERIIANQKAKLILQQDGGLSHVELDAAEATKPSLLDSQVLEIAGMAMDFESFYGVAQDVEWAYDHNGDLIVLQTRALHGAPAVEELPDLPEGAKLLLDGGVCASAGVGAGRVFIVRRDEDMLQFPRGAVLVVEQAHSRWAPVLGRASAVVSEYGGAAGHLASVAREYGVPAIFGLTNAVSLLAPETIITVDADARRVFRDAVEEVLARKASQQQTFAGSPVHKALATCVHFIVPLHLLYPDSPMFTPKYCTTLHDITRFCHEKAVEEMFRLDEDLFEGRCGKQLKYKGSKLQYFLVNIGEGFCQDVTGKYVDISQVCSIPMQALWDGMTAIPWAGPPAASARSFLSVVAASASNPDLEITSSSMRMTRNYFMVDREYCNLQASFGYHFCTVEANAGEESQENYVSFHFKGGAANLNRRQMRVHLIADILAENGFIIDVKEDALSARAEELTACEVCELLNIIGYLLIHTRQMDAALQSESMRLAFADMLRKGIAKTLALCGSA